MNEMQVRFPGIKKMSSVQKYDPHTQMEYLETKWDLNGHAIDINVDEVGAWPRVDGGNCDGPFDEGGLLGWLARLVAKII